VYIIITKQHKRKGNKINKLYADKMSYRQWQDGYELRYDTMPAWWRNEATRKKAWKNYLDDHAINNGVVY
tara:strand:+ start:250 stop:459 length:210 start_codon:yes stop_codon:yes gene_type:complete